MRKVFIPCLLAIFAFASLNVFCEAAETSPAEAPAPSAADQAKEVDIRKMLDLSGSGHVGVQVMNQMLKSFRQQMPQVPNEFWDEIEKDIKPQDLVDMMVPIYARHFSADEIKQLIAFYESPIGKKMTAEMPAITSESMTAGQQWGRNLATTVLQHLRDKGYLPKA